MVGALAFLVATAALVAAPRRARADEAVIFVDLRAGDDGARRADRDALASELGRFAGIGVRRDAAFESALAGESAALGADPAPARAAAALTEARTGYGALDCAQTRAAAERAVDELAGLQAVQAGADGRVALPAETTDQLQQAYAYLLLCADTDGDSDRALAVVKRLHALGVRGAPAGVSDAVWSRYPAIDVTANLALVELVVSTTPAGAAVWLDHRFAGVAPATLYVAPGTHLIAAATPAGARAVQRIDTAGGAVPLTLLAPPGPGPHAARATQIVAWRSGTETPTAAALTEILTDAGVRFALVLAGAAGAAQVEVWALAPDTTVARKVKTAGTGDAIVLAAAVADRAAAWDGRAPDPDLPLLLENPDGPVTRAPEKWWVYASIIGAVVLGAGIVYLHESADDVQRIELVYP